ncbi:hypothetical protein OSTOST_08663, partial [Ostertagia ostertagi]
MEGIDDAKMHFLREISLHKFFNKGDRTSHWYLLLAGEVQLFLPGYYPGSEALPLCSLSAGSLFGELDIDRHCCSAVVTRQAEFVRISQRIPSHLIATRSDAGVVHPLPNGDVNGIHSTTAVTSYPQEYHGGPTTSFDVSAMQAELDQVPQHSYDQGSIIEFNNAI